jgi:hypothetical protein
MNLDCFSENMIVKYKDHIGKIRFIGHEYITLCIGKYQREVCILIYPNQWKDIELLKQSEK